MMDLSPGPVLEANIADDRDRPPGRIEHLLGGPHQDRQSRAHDPHGGQPARDRDADGLALPWSDRLDASRIRPAANLIEQVARQPGTPARPRPG